MTDLVKLARLRRDEVRAEIDALNQFIRIADGLLRLPARTGGPTAPGRTVPGQTGPGQTRPGQTGSGQMMTARPGAAAASHPVAAKAASPVKGGHGNIGQAHRHDQAAAKASDMPSPDWTIDTFHFEQLVTGAA